jgi:TPP-dependent pyruvate/acetoin dehydrogenase alpha subunit
VIAESFYEHLRLKHLNNIFRFKDNSQLIPDQNKLLSLHRSMILQRLFEEKVISLWAKGLIPGLAHSYIGQEAVAAGVCGALEGFDYIISNHRGHGHSLAKGVKPEAIFAELFGRETGVCRGLGGSMHSTDIEAGVLFSTAIVGGGIPLAVGAALALKMTKKKSVVACFFGDGAVNTGAFHEGINLASVWKVPVIFVCENNYYASLTHTPKVTAVKEIADRAVAYNIPGVSVDGMDVLAVHESALKAIQRAREGKGPSLLECKTYRFKGHGPYDTGLEYRTREEVAEWMKRDPIKNLESILLKKGFLTQSELDFVMQEIGNLIETSASTALKSPYPSPELLFEFLPRKLFT